MGLHSLAGDSDLPMTKSVGGFCLFLDGGASLTGAFVGSRGRGILSVLMKVSQRSGGILRFMVDEDVCSVMTIPVLFDSHPPSDRPF